MRRVVRKLRSAQSSRGEYPATVFGVMGRDEKRDLRAGVALERRPAFAKALIERIAGGEVSADERFIRLQRMATSAERQRYHLKLPVNVSGQRMPVDG